MENELLIVDIEENGVIHFENGRLIVGDLDIIKKAEAMAGLKRQRGRVLIRLFVQSRATIDVSPDMSGAYAEASEPAA